MNINYLNAKQVTKNIELYNLKLETLQDEVNLLKMVIGIETKKLNTLLKTLTKEENIEYGLECGFIEKDEYTAIMDMAK